MRTLKELCERDKTDLESPHIHALLQAEQIALGRCIQRHSWAATSHGGVQLASTGDVIRSRSRGARRDLGISPESRTKLR